jgi:hypothetical protein
MSGINVSDAWTGFSAPKSEAESIQALHIRTDVRMQQAIADHVRLRVRHGRNPCSKVVKRGFADVQIIHKAEARICRPVAQAVFHRKRDCDDQLDANSCRFEVAQFPME